MANTEALDRSAYGSNFANYTAWQNFLANQSEQARNENDNYWNNLWNTVKNIGSAALTAYDGYKGYTQQQWENDFAREQWEYNKNRTDQSDALNAYQQRSTCTPRRWGCGQRRAEPVRPERKRFCQLHRRTGDPGRSGRCSEHRGFSGGKRKSGSSGQPAEDVRHGQQCSGRLQHPDPESTLGGAGKESSNWFRRVERLLPPEQRVSKSELRNLMKDRESVAAKGGDTTWYDGILADAGYPVPETKNTESTGGQSSDTGTLLAQRYAKRGYSAWAIANIMSQNGYSDKEISDALEKAGVE